MEYKSSFFERQDGVPAFSALEFSPRQNDYALLIHIPLLLQIFGLWATSGYGGEFRFYWPQNTVCLVYLLTLPFLCRAKEQI